MIHDIHDSILCFCQVCGERDIFLPPEGHDGEGLTCPVCIARLEEREACAKIAENPDHIAIVHDLHDAPWADGEQTQANIAAAIRARGETL